MIKTQTRRRANQQTEPEIAARGRKRSAIAPAPKNAATLASPPRPERPPSKLDQITALLLRPNGATPADLMAATGWQAHSIRGALAGALRRRGLVITSSKTDGIRRYSATLPEHR